MNQEPRRKAFSQAEIINEAIQWVKDKYTGDERYHILGLLVDFATDIVPTDRSERTEDSRNER